MFFGPKEVPYGKQLRKMAAAPRPGRLRDRTPERLMALIREISRVLDEKKSAGKKRQLGQTSDPQHHLLASEGPNRDRTSSQRLNGITQLFLWVQRWLQNPVSK